MIWFNYISYDFLSVYATDVYTDPIYTNNRPTELRKSSHKKHNTRLLFRARQRKLSSGIKKRLYLEDVKKYWNSMLIVI